MNLRKALKVLDTHNKWRRGDEKLEMTNPTELGVAIDTIVKEVSLLINPPKTTCNNCGKKVQMVVTGHFCPRCCC